MKRAKQLPLFDHETTDTPLFDVIASHDDRETAERRHSTFGPFPWPMALRWQEEFRQDKRWPNQIIEIVRAS